MNKLPDIPPRIIKAFSHDLRKRIIVALMESGELSPNQISQKLGEPLGNVSYHIRILLDECKIVELKKTEPRRGALEHFYVLTKSAKKWIASN